MKAATAQLRKSNLAADPNLTRGAMNRQDIPDVEPIGSGELLERLTLHPGDSITRIT